MPQRRQCSQGRKRPGRSRAKPGGGSPTHPAASASPCLGLALRARVGEGPGREPPAAGPGSPAPLPASITGGQPPVCHQSPRVDGASLLEGSGTVCFTAPILSPEAGWHQGAVGGLLFPRPALTWGGAPGHSPEAEPHLHRLCIWDPGEEAVVVSGRRGCCLPAAPLMQSWVPRPALKTGQP